MKGSVGRETVEPNLGGGVETRNLVSSGFVVVISPLSIRLYQISNFKTDHLPSFRTSLSDEDVAFDDRPFLTQLIG